MLIVLELLYRCFTLSAVIWDHVSSVRSRAVAVDDASAEGVFAHRLITSDDSDVTHFE
jgi:hypothetical protein